MDVFCSEAGATDKLQQKTFQVGEGALNFSFEHLSISDSLGQSRSKSLKDLPECSPFSAFCGQRNLWRFLFCQTELHRLLCTQPNIHVAKHDTKLVTAPLAVRFNFLFANGDSVHSRGCGTSRLFWKRKFLPKKCYLISCNRPKFKVTFVKIKIPSKELQLSFE